MSALLDRSLQRIGMPRTLFAIIMAMICLHSCMTGIRMAAPLQALRDGQTQWVVGVLLALFAVAPVVLALHSGRLVDRLGFHYPMRLASGLCLIAGLLACGASFAQGYLQVGLMAFSALVSGAGSNMGLIAIQRTAARMTQGERTELLRVFSWLGLAPALANVLGPFLAGVLIDLFGFAVAYGVLALLPCLSLYWSAQVPREKIEAPPPAKNTAASFELLRTPGLKRLLLVNWLLSTSWDLHAFLLPILGHERGLSASSIGMILGLFAACVALIRLAIPMLAHRTSPKKVLNGAMLMVGVLYAIYPMTYATWQMAVMAALLGLCLGSVQPMIMSTLHQMAPPDRQGEAIALRSMTINFASTAMPIVFGAAGVALGVSAVFWAMALMISVGSRLVQGLPSVATEKVD